jgi:hypothetical protein
MKNVIPLIFILLLASNLYSQNKINIDSLHYQYIKSFDVLMFSKKIIDNDQIIKNEKTALLKKYNSLSDSLKPILNNIDHIELEQNRIIFNCQTSPDLSSYKNSLKKLYVFSNENPKILIDKAENILKTADMVMLGFENYAENEKEVADYAAKSTSEFYKQIGAADWTIKDRQRLINLFATRYTKRQTYLQAGYYYRHFDTLFREKEVKQNLVESKIPEIEQTYLEGNLYPTIYNQDSLKNKKIVLIPKHQDLFRLTHLINILKSKKKAYKDYDVLILRDPNIISDPFLKVLNDNLTFSNYYIGNYAADNKNILNFPSYTLWDESGIIKIASNNAIPFFEELNKPVREEQEKTTQEYLRLRETGLKKLDSLKKHPADVSVKFTSEHDNIKLILRGSWPENVSTRIDSNAFDDVKKPSRVKAPDIVMLEITSENRELYKLPVFIDIEKDNLLTITNIKSEVSINFESEDNQQLYDAYQKIKYFNLAKSAYLNIIKEYPFKNSEFIDFLESKINEYENKIKKVYGSLDDDNKKNKLKRITDDFYE